VSITPEICADSQSLNTPAQQEALSSVLASCAFRSAPVMARLLKYLAKQAQPETIGRLSAYQIAVAVFDRPSDFDPQSNSLVRVNMRRLRQLLDEYYADAGANDEFRLHLASGSYILRLLPNTVFPPQALPQLSLAVLRVENIPKDPDQEWFCDLMTLEMVHLLSQHHAIRVVVPHTNFPLPRRMGTTAKALTDFQLNCTAQVTDKGKKPPNQYHLNFTARLIDLRNQQTLWTKEYSNNMSIRFLRNSLEDITWHAWTLIISPHAPVHRPPKGKLRWKFPV
jgi:TolB-like protein